MEELLQRARQGDPEAFVLLIEGCRTDLYRVARGFFRSDEDAADAIQQTVLDCYEQLGRLKKLEYFKTWLIRILVNNCNDLLRAGRRYAPETELPETGAPDPGQADAEFRALLDSLDEPYRVVLLLYYGEGLRVREIGTALGLSDEAVKSRLRRGREQARRAYEQ